MAAKAKPKPEIVRWLRNDLLTGGVRWSSANPPGVFTETIAYGWSDGLMTWTEERN